MTKFEFSEIIDKQTGHGYSIILHDHILKIYRLENWGLKPVKEIDMMKNINDVFQPEKTKVFS